MFNFFFFNDTATTEIYTLSLHDALPILRDECGKPHYRKQITGGNMGFDPFAKPFDPFDVSEEPPPASAPATRKTPFDPRSEEHTSELQSQSNLVCRLLLEKKNINTATNP